MAFASLPAKGASDTLTLTNYNTIRDNFEETAPGLATAKGDLVVATAANAVARLAVGANDSILAEGRHCAVIRYEGHGAEFSHFIICCTTVPIEKRRMTST